MMPSADQHRWFTHHPGISPNAHPDVTGLAAGAANFPTPGTAGPHHPVINPYMEASYIDDMHHHMDGQGPTGYYGLNMQYRAAHQRTLSGECSDCFHQYKPCIKYFHPFDAVYYTENN